jgi:hypothetical protein
MPKENAAALARTAIDRHSSSSLRMLHLYALTAVLVVLIAIGSLHVNAIEQSEKANFQAPQAGVTVGMASEPTAARLSGGDDIAPSSNGVMQVSLFLGYVEFDWAPATPGGVPGFGPWPSTVAESRMEN